MALSILYFFYARAKLADASSYTEEETATEMHFKALTVMFIVVSVWIIVTFFSAAITF
jgi:uncharacterized membrane-anchored protein